MVERSFCGQGSYAYTPSFGSDGADGRILPAVGRPHMEETLHELDREIVDAHRRGDGGRLAHLYIGAAQRLAAEGELARAAFLFVNAYVWALDAGEEDVACQARRILAEMGRED